MTEGTKKVKVSIVGSFHRSQDELRKLFEFAQATYILLSPQSIDWKDSGGEFVRIEADKSLSTAEIEDRHLEALRDSDFIILHAPEGYVGSSAIYELGFAKALGIPVLSTHPIKDEILSSFVVAGDFTSSKILGVPTDFDSGRGIKTLQKYYKRAAKRRGWDKETAKDTLLLLTEELGELARAIRKHEKINRDHEYNIELSEELADVQLYLVHLANQTNIDLGDAVTAKEQTNETRFKTK